MANKEHLVILKQGVEAWNQWCRDNPDVSLDLRRADLSCANLNEVDFRRTDLRYAKLSRANLHKAILHEAILIHANLFGANLNEADLCGADLRGSRLGWANLNEADLRRTDLRYAKLGRARLGRMNLSGAVLRETIFANVDLSNVNGLETCKHYGPSTLDHRTLQRSGNLPQVFLRGCGLSDLLIDYLPTLLNQPIQYYSCFISFSTKDQDFASRIHADLQAKGVRCWFAPHHIQGGRKIHEQIDAAIRLHDKLLLTLSQHSMKSDWVGTEIAKARRREVKEGRRVLFPVRFVNYETLRDWECFDADIGKDSAKEIREYFIPDFSTWKDHDTYQLAFERLLRDLKPALETPPESP